MPIYTVHVPRTVADPMTRAERTRFVRDGFSIWAFLFGPLFLLRHRAWIATLVWLVLVVAGASAANLVHLPVFSEVLLFILLELFLGFEGNALRRGVLDRRGYAFADVVAGRRREEIELGFFRNQDLGDAEPIARPVHAAPAPQRRPQGGSDAVIGMFPTQNG